MHPSQPRAPAPDKEYSNDYYQGGDDHYTEDYTADDYTTFEEHRQSEPSLPEIDFEKVNAVARVPVYSSHSPV